jgi:Na+-driven multidrug efflux pump
MAPLAILTVSLLIVRFPLAQMAQARWHVDAIWWSFPISSALAAVLAVIYYKYGGWRSAHMLAEINAAPANSDARRHAESATGT